MKKEIENLAKKAVTDIANKPISRKEAIKKTGYVAVSAATMMLLLNSPAQACTSTENEDKGNNGHGNGDQDPPGNSGGNNNAENGPGKNSGEGPW